MLQRIQTIYLLVAVCVMTATGFLCVMTYQTAAAPEAVHAFRPVDAWWSALCVFVPAALWCASIFLYTRRPLQMRVVRWANILCALYLLALAGCAFYHQVESSQVAHIGVQMTAGLNFVALLCGILARHYIHKDEKLVRAADRIR